MYTVGYGVVMLSSDFLHYPFAHDSACHLSAILQSDGSDYGIHSSGHDRAKT